MTRSNIHMTIEPGCTVLKAGQISTKNTVKIPTKIDQHCNDNNVSCSQFAVHLIL